MCRRRLTIGRVPWILRGTLFTVAAKGFSMMFSALGCIGLASAVAITILVCCVGLLLAASPPRYEPWIHRSEARDDLNSIRRAELDHHDRWGAFKALDWRPSTIPGAQQVMFIGDEDWGPASGLEWWTHSVYCRYRVDVADDGEDFEARAECDLDEDGVVSVFVATRHEMASRITPWNVY